MMPTCPPSTRKWTKECWGLGRLGANPALQLGQPRHCPHQSLVLFLPRSRCWGITDASSRKGPILPTSLHIRFVLFERLFLTWLEMGCPPHQGSRTVIPLGRSTQKVHPNVLPAFSLPLSPSIILTRGVWNLYHQDVQKWKETTFVSILSLSSLFWWPWLHCPCLIPSTPCSLLSPTRLLWFKPMSSLTQPVKWSPDWAHTPTLAPYQGMLNFGSNSSCPHSGITNPYSGHSLSMGILGCQSLHAGLGHIICFGCWWIW